MRYPNIQQRVLFVALVPALVIGLTLTLYLIILRHNDADAALQENGAMLARQLAPAAEFGIFSGNFLELRRLAESVTREADVSAVSFHDKYGDRLLATGAPLFEKNILDLPDRWQGSNITGDTLFFHVKIRRIPQHFIDPFSESTIGTITEADSSNLIGSVTVELSRHTLIARKKETFLITVLIFLAAFSVAILLGRRLSRDVTDPVRALQTAVDAIRSGNLETRVLHHPSQTLHQLESGINDMAFSIESMAQSLRSAKNTLEIRIKDATQELRQKKEEAEQVSHAKSRFLAAASHDLRQPLHALTLFVAKLEQQPQSAHQTSVLRQINRATDVLNSQFKSLLDISRIDLGDVEAQAENFPLSPFMERLVTLYMSEANAKDLRLRCIHHPSLWCHSDPRLLERILSNLLANAIRYTDHGGIVLGVRRRATELRLDVIDTGLGIREDQLALIFHEFYQINNLERSAENGLGLGLSIVSRLANLLGHRIEVRSRPGRGTRFSITLPHATPARVNTMGPKLRHTNPEHLDINVLIFDEPGIQRQTLCDLLDRWGCCHLHEESVENNRMPGSIAPDVIIGTHSRIAWIKTYLSRSDARFSNTPVILLGAECQDLFAICHTLSLPLRPARLRALLQQCVLKANNND